MTTDAQIQANRRNAENSTGPRSEAGKSASSANSLKHGAYSTKLVAIPRGHFAEDQDEVDSYVQALVESLGPRDAIEVEAAHWVATCFLRFRRLSRLESEAVAGDTQDRSLFPVADPFLSDDQAADARRELDALRALQQSVNLVTVIDARTATALDKAFGAYQRLQQRALPVPAEDDE